MPQRISSADQPRISRLIRLLTDSRPESLVHARRQIAAAVARGGLDSDAAQDVETAAGEALSNVRRHAYDGGQGPLFVEVFCTQRSVGVIVIDHGKAKRPGVVPDVPPPREHEGGRGLYLMDHLTDEMDIRVNAIGHGLAVLLLKRPVYRGRLAA